MFVFFPFSNSEMISHHFLIATTIYIYTVTRKQVRDPFKSMAHHLLDAKAIFEPHNREKSHIINPDVFWFHRE
jgi:hypothetical protein